MAFGIILKYYSQGLKPLGSTLSLSFQPSSPQSLTQVFGSLVPHHSFIMVIPHTKMFCINTMHNYMYKNQALGLQHLGSLA